MKLGVCYYPEHWPETDWAEDARMMRAAGIRQVRIGEFAWSRIEPDPGRYDWGWLDRAIATLWEHELGIVLCTPTATPPKWLVDRYEDILPVDGSFLHRRFGSRRHYCFSSLTYRRESRRITEALAARYGRHPAVIMWQTDNEFGHHGSDESFSPDAVAAFRNWLVERYGQVRALNEAWGTVFWSQEYRSFEEVDPPAATVTEANPSHLLDWRRFCSDQMCSFNREQADIIRRLSPQRPITHNFIGDFFRLDHRAMGRDLDIASWDSYPIGLLSESRADEGSKLAWLRTGDPDFAAFNHDVFRACAPAWGVMEQQPGPVNWARYNPAPAAGMVRLWSWEAFAHGAGFVSYFRWRQAPFAQEQMHAGLLGTDRSVQPVFKEILQLSQEMSDMPALRADQARVAIFLDYPGLWQAEIQPHGFPDGPLAPVRRMYSACRRLGLDVDFVFPDSRMEGYRIILIPSARLLSREVCDRLRAGGALILATALTGSRDESGHIPESLAPGAYGEAAGLRVLGFESLPASAPVEVCFGSGRFAATTWREWIEAEAEPFAWFADGSPAATRCGRLHYLACWPSPELLQAILQTFCEACGLQIHVTGEGLRLRRAGDVCFAFNYGPSEADLCGLGIVPEGTSFLLGAATLGPAGLAAWLSPARPG